MAVAALGGLRGRPTIFPAILLTTVTRQGRLFQNSATIEKTLDREVKSLDDQNTTLECHLYTKL